MISRGHGFQRGKLIQLLELMLPLKLVYVTDLVAWDVYAVQASNFLGHDNYPIMQAVLPDKQAAFLRNARRRIFDREPRGVTMFVYFASVSVKSGDVVDCTIDGGPKKVLFYGAHTLMIGRTMSAPSSTCGSSAHSASLQ